jgi:hypothetical protein
MLLKTGNAKIFVLAYSLPNLSKKRVQVPEITSSLRGLSRNLD